jgi:predicted dehydrogenase
MPAVSLVVIGAGNRGTGYGRWVLANPARARVVAVAEPRQVRRDRFAAAHSIGTADAVEDWRQLAARDRFADAVLVCTQDRMHAEPVEAFAALGYHVLLEKPMAPDEQTCRRVVAATERAGVLLAVGHVMRYTPYTTAVKRIVDSGQLGAIMSIEHLEPVGFWHQAHSFVRGNWRRADQATSMLLAKSCHDLDWLQYILGQPPQRVSSFGRLSHFTRDHQPEGAADRCVDCAVEASCAYSATRLYGGMVSRGQNGWPLDVILDECTPAALDEALRAGPYGRCVYACDNDVVDHQVVAMEFPDGVTATFTMTAFNEAGGRRTRIFGTRGELSGDGETIRIFDFVTGQTRMVTPEQEGAMSAAEGHGGGDAGLMEAFTQAVALGDPEPIRSGPSESLASHLACFAAERARLNGTVETVRYDGASAAR